MNPMTTAARAQAKHNAAKILPLRPSASILHLAFALTGMGTVLLGCLLPRVSAQWHLADDKAGLLLLIEFATSASGALLVRRDLSKTMAVGYGLFALGGICFFLAQQSLLLLGTALGIFGLGLGIAMTSTNIMVSRRYPERRGAALALLNFSWSAGAVSCPLIVARFLRHVSSGSIFGLLGLLVVPFWVSFLVLPTPPAPSPSTVLSASVKTDAKWIATFAMLAFLYVGIESALGSWMSTFATRMASSTVMGSSMAVAAFWGALLMGRAVTPALLIAFREGRLYALSLAFVVAGIGLLLIAHGQPTMLAGAAVTGLALAPLFPLILSRFLGNAEYSINAGWVFAVAGLGGAVLSWLAGVVSTRAGSVRFALTVPAAAALLMLVLARQPSAQTTTPPSETSHA